MHRCIYSNDSLDERMNPTRCGSFHFQGWVSSHRHHHGNTDAKVQWFASQGVEATTAPRNIKRASKNIRNCKTFMEILDFQLWSIDFCSKTGLRIRHIWRLPYSIKWYEMYEGMVNKLISCIVYFGSIEHIENLWKIISVFVIQKAVCSMLPGWCAFSSSWLLVVRNPEGFGGDGHRESRRIKPYTVRKQIRCHWTYFFGIFWERIHECDWGEFCAFFKLYFFMINPCW